MASCVWSWNVFYRHYHQGILRSSSKSGDSGYIGKMNCQYYTHTFCLKMELLLYIGEIWHSSQTPIITPGKSKNSHTNQLPPELWEILNKGLVLFRHAKTWWHLSICHGIILSFFVLPPPPAHLALVKFYKSNIIYWPTCSSWVPSNYLTKTLLEKLGYKELSQHCTNFWYLYNIWVSFVLSDWINFSCFCSLAMKWSKLCIKDVFVLDSRRRRLEHMCNYMAKISEIWNTEFWLDCAHWL